LAISALRTRRADILPLAMRLLASLCPPGARIPALSAAAGQRLLAYAWPGNVRELENVMHRALVLCEGAVIECEQVSFEPTDSVTEAATDRAPTPVTVINGDLAQTRAAAEYELILDTLRRSGNSRERVAERLGISPRTLRYKLARMRAAGIGLAVIGSAA